MAVLLLPGSEVPPVPREAARLIMDFESCAKRRKDGRFGAYICAAGYPTIGWGHVVLPAERERLGAGLTQEECDDLFRRDLAKFARRVWNLIQTPTAAAEFGAMVSLAFNIGAGALGSSTLLRRHNAADRKAVAVEFPKWRRAGGRVLAGLVRRRKAELALYKTAAQSAAAGTDGENCPKCGWRLAA